MKQRKKTKGEIADLWYNENKGQIDWSIKENRERFRLTNAWKHFCNRVKHHTCDFCTCHTNRINLHHLDPLHYDDLDSSKFACLCFSCHTKVQQLSRRKDRSTVPEYFLPYLETNYQ